MLSIKSSLPFPDMGRCAITRGRQALELRSNLSERRSLTDQIQTTECSASYSARNLQWAVAHGTLSTEVNPQDTTLQKLLPCWHEIKILMLE